MGRPRVVTFNLASVDGRLTLAPGGNLMTGDPRWAAVIAGIEDPYVWARDAHDPEVLLEGSGSFLSPAHGGLVPIEVADDAEGEHFLPPEVMDVPGRRCAVVDGRGLVDLRFTEWPDPTWAGWHALVITSLAAPAEHLERLRNGGIPYLVVGREHVALGPALDLLSDRLDVRTVVATGGGRLGGALLRQHLVDEVDVELLPVAIGGRGTPALFDAAPLLPEEWPTRLELVTAETLVDGRVRLRYRVLNPR
jgi:riboflavin biosynthesis pyrimidine reductase